MLALAALILDEASVRWFIAVLRDSIKKQYSLHLFRLGLLVLAGGCIALWCLRKIIADDWRAAVLRWKDISTRVDVSAVIPAIQSSFAKKILWLFLPIWMVAVTICLIPGYESMTASLTREKGIFETLTVILYCFSGLIAFKLAISHFGHNSPRGFFRWWLLGLAFGCLFIAAEESNWGAMYFHYKAGDLIRQINYQNEVGFHNMRLPFIGAWWAEDTLHLIAACGGVLLPLLIWLSNFFRRAMLAIEAPLPPWISQAYFLVATLIPWDHLIELQRGNTSSELREVTVSIGVAIWLWCTMQNRLKMDR